MNDFTVGIIEPMLDIKAVESGGDSLKGTVAAQVLLNSVSIPKSFELSMLCIPRAGSGMAVLTLLCLPLQGAGKGASLVGTSSMQSMTLH